MAMAAAALCLASDPVCKSNQPCYREDSIVNIASGVPRIAPNTLASIHGTLLSYSEKGLVPSDVSKEHVLPTLLPETGVQVFVGGTDVPIFYVSESQVNFLVPSNLRPTTVDVWVVRDGVAGPKVPMKLREAAPALFTLDPLDPLFVTASHLDFSLVTADAPARPGDWVILWATGLGNYISNPVIDSGVIPTVPAWIVRQNEFQVLLNGVAVPPERITYVGLAPWCAGLYQINVLLPSDADPDPEVKIKVGTEEISPAGTRLHLRAPGN